MRLIQPPLLLSKFYSRRWWRMKTNEKKVYLTFDDGPIDQVTPWVLDVLKEFKVKGTFFCIGDNIRKNPEIFMRILREGHSTGNHTFHHVNGKKTPISTYLEEVEQTDILIEDILKRNNIDLPDTKLFRPPYGRITKKQAESLEEKGFQIVMWDIISYDFDKEINEEKCLKNVLNNLRKGSIIVFHDSLKAEKNLKYALPKLLKYLDKKGYECVPL